MKRAYPIILTQGQAGIVVYIPDFHINTQGADLATAIEMARDAIGTVGVDMEDEKEALPNPSEISAIASSKIGDIISLVDVDFSEYRKKQDMRAVKKNCTIPSWLNFEAEKAGINFSAVLQAALKKELHIAD